MYTVYKKIRRSQVTAVLSSIGFVLAIGTVMFHTLEDWTWIQSFYFTVVTTTTVGYGDLHPTTDVSRLATSVFVLFGVGILVSAVGYTGTYFIRKNEERLLKNEEKIFTNKDK